MSRLQHMRLLLLALAIALSASTALSGEVTFEAAADPVWGKAECPAAGERPRSGGIPASFEAAWVLRCREEIRDIPGNGRWRVTVVERADTTAKALLRELRKPTEQPVAGMGCGPGFAPVPHFALVDRDGGVLVPTVPADWCDGGPADGVLPALESLPFRALSERLDEQMFSEATKFGCEDELADEFLTPRAPGPAETVWLRPAHLRVCEYVATSDGRGRFVSGRAVGRADDDRLADALENAGPALDCTARHTRFAVITSAEQRWTMTAELDGCRRVLRPSELLGQLDEAAVAMLAR
ncbi:hypothetical protein FKR81_03025 [Lentzea tibetensis]|uniref:Uncharacterized protein n=1 Tax=Lentzea tibetensis TaxID=2591470 RepID=A0A563F190_9PSEU|nr:hypothetical protein [Lentzea tibetensis]TWP53745.1 hypothetical protein FKR81_03025 [Lentzea tibetensis]